MKSYLSIFLILSSIILSAMPGNTVFDNVESLNASNFDIEGLDLSNGGGIENYEKININGKTVELISTTKGLSASVNDAPFKLVNTTKFSLPSSKLVPIYDIVAHEKSYILLGHIGGASATSQINLSVDANDNVTATERDIYYSDGLYAPLNDCVDKEVDGVTCKEKTFTVGTLKMKTVNPLSNLASSWENVTMSNSVNDTAIGLDNGHILQIEESSRWDDASMVMERISKDSHESTYALDPTTILPGAALQNRFYNVTDLAKEEGVIENNCRVTKIWVFRQGKNDHSIHEIVTLTYTAEGSCSCSATEHLEDNICISNTKESSCNIENNNPLNSTDIVEDVTITWNSTTESWPPAPACPWACDNTYHKNINQCDPNEITTQCANNIENSPCEVNTLIDVTSVWDSQLNQYITPECETTFLSDHHEVGDRCINNTMQTNCTEVTVDNGNSIDVMVTINWVNNSWEDAPDCDFSCNEGFHKDGLTCIANSLNCNATQHEENDSCVDNTKQVHCTEVTIDNGNSIDDMVTINWVDNSWEDVTNCDFSCNEGYHKDGLTCITNSLSQKRLDMNKILEYLNAIELRIEDEDPLSYKDGSEMQTVYRISDDLKLIIKFEDSFKGFRIDNLTSRPIEITFDSNLDGDREKITIWGYDFLYIKGAINNQKVEIDWSLDINDSQLTQINIEKSGEPIHIKGAVNNTDSSVNVFNLSSPGSKFGYIKDKIENDIVECAILRFDSSHPDTVITITINGKKTEFKPTAEFETIFMPLDSDHKGMLKINGEWTNSKKIENQKIVDTKEEIDPTSSNSSCSYSTNSSNNIFILLLFIGLIYFRRRKGSMQ